MQGRYLPAPQASRPTNGRAGGYIPAPQRKNIFREGNKSMRGQWQEGGDNYGARKFETRDIEEFRKLLVDSYECANTDITFRFSRITDEFDDDRATCLNLTYELCFYDPYEGKKVIRNIYATKVLVPQQVLNAAKRGF